MRSTISSSILAIVTAIATTAPSLLAQPSPQAPLSATVRAAVMDTTIARVTSTYVDADTARLIANVLRAQIKAHAYDAITNPAQLAEAVTKDLRVVNADLHLSMRYSSVEPTSSGRGGNPFGDPRQLNFGMGRAEILDGNVGYLEITGFTGGPYQDAVVDALRFLSRTDAMIIDVRRNPGGASEMSHFIFSHFLTSESVPTVNVRTRASSEPRRNMSVANVPGPRRPNVPLFVLTSQGTASAAEEFSFVLKNRHRATIVGTRTAGAGHMVTTVPVGYGFSVSLSITRVSDPETGREWEQVGVQPDIAVSAENALDAAHVAALKTIITNTPEVGREKTLRRMLQTIEARQQRVAIDAGQLSKFAGTYEGRVVSVRDGRLWYARREGALSELMTPLGGDVFALGAVRMRFIDRAGHMAIEVEQADGNQVTLARESSR